MYEQTVCWAGAKKNKSNKLKWQSGEKIEERKKETEELVMINSCKLELSCWSMSVNSMESTNANKLWQR